MTIIRPAIKDDQKIIRAMVRGARLNPTGLDWKNFRMADDEQGQIIACGQLKIHKDGVRELASIVVREDQRGNGLGKRMIHELTDEADLPVWLMCRSALAPLYQRFGFIETLDDEQMPHYFRRMKRLVGAFEMFARTGEHLAVMLKSQK
jgi:N-acetylglutamate synthase-like GNAT family acetyltransferase